jgi:hypothetical protein
LNRVLKGYLSMVRNSVLVVSHSCCAFHYTEPL